VIFRRLFAPTAAHTTQRQARACASCHNDPVALGYGKGRLSFDAAPGGRTGSWRFKQAEPALAPDGLPADAWTGFLAERDGMVSTQAGARPFKVAEQQRILTVGACLTCHAGESALMRASVRDFPGLLRRRTAQCVAPAWVQP
jgi:cytochrome c553